MSLLDLSRLSAGARVHHELRVVSRETRRTKDGKPFVVLTLGNAQGELATAPIWSENLSWADGADRGAIVQAIGEITSYGEGVRQKRQLQLTSPLRPIDPTLVTLDDFLPRIADEIEPLWAAVDRLRGEIVSPVLRRVVGLFFDDDAFRVQFERWPAAPRGHHAKIGGLLRHVVEVATIARVTARLMKSPDGMPANVDVVVAGALLHDVGKVEAYSVDAAGFDTTACGHLLGHIVLGVVMLERRLAAVGERICSDDQLLEIQHLILAHHGSLEFGSPVRPMTLEAEIVHWADESSAKATSFAEAVADQSLFPEGSTFSDRVWTLDNRRVWAKSHQWE